MFMDSNIVCYVKQAIRIVSTPKNIKHDLYGQNNVTEEIQRNDNNNSNEFQSKVTKNYTEKRFYLRRKFIWLFGFESKIVM